MDPLKTLKQDENEKCFYGHCIHMKDELMKEFDASKYV